MGLTYKWLFRVSLIAMGLASLVHASDIHQIDPGETETFTGHTPCVRVTHDSSITKSYFVGAKTSAEYQSFYDEVKLGTIPALSASACP